MHTRAAIVLSLNMVVYTIWGRTIEKTKIMVKVIVSFTILGNVDSLDDIRQAVYNTIFY